MCTPEPHHNNSEPISKQPRRDLAIPRQLINRRCDRAFTRRVNLAPKQHGHYHAFDGVPMIRRKLIRQQRKCPPSLPALKPRYGHSLACGTETNLSPNDGSGLSHASILNDHKSDTAAQQPSKNRSFQMQTLLRIRIPKKNCYRKQAGSITSSARETLSSNWGLPT
jgi:hypothetical protein